MAPISMILGRNRSRRPDLVFRKFSRRRKFFCVNKNCRDERTNEVTENFWCTPQSNRNRRIQNRHGHVRTYKQGARFSSDFRPEKFVDFFLFERTRTYPNTSERIRKHPNRSERVRKGSKTCENDVKLARLFFDFFSFRFYVIFSVAKRRTGLKI